MKKNLITVFSFLLFICCCFLPFGSFAAPAPDVSVIQDGIRFSECVRPYDGGVLIANYGSKHKIPAIHEIKGYILYRKDGQTKTLFAFTIYSSRKKRPRRSRFLNPIG